MYIKALYNINASKTKQSNDKRTKVKLPNIRYQDKVTIQELGGICLFH